LTFDHEKDDYAFLSMKEDIIEGMRGSEFDSEKMHSIGVHIAKKRVNHLG
jgi:hypothetical protein